MGILQPPPIPYTSGKVDLITTARRSRYIRYSHIPIADVDSMRGISVAFPSCQPRGDQPDRAEKLDILLAHIGFSEEEVSIDYCEWVIRHACLCGIVRNILWKAQRHFEINLPSYSTGGRAC